MMLFDSHDPAFRSPSTPVPFGEKVLFRFRCDEAETVALRTWMER